MSSLLLAFLASMLISCGASKESITVYSGRTEALIGPVFKRWEEQSDINVKVKYGDSADLALLINEEGERTPADIFISQSPGAVGYLAARNVLAKIPTDLSAQILPQYQSDDGTWLGITGRQRVLVYNPELVNPSDLPQTIAELTDPKYRGKVGVAPNNGSFQDFITAMRFGQGDDVVLSWLEGMAENNSPNYPKNSAIISAVVAGEVEMGLVNHYYLLRELDENPSADGQNHYLDSRDVGSLLIITTGAVIESSDKKDSAFDLLDFLIQEDSQTYFVEQTKEYPLIAGVGTPSGVPDLNAFASETLNDFELLGSELLRTIQLIADSGIIQG